MNCIYCGKKTQVVNSRPKKTDIQTWRRRTCTGCHTTVTTIEQIDLANALQLQKRDGTYQPFSRDKLFLSIYRAVDHLDNPVDTAHHLTSTVLRHIYKVKPLDYVVPYDVLSYHVSTVLKHYNAAASVRYLSFQTSLKLPNDVRRSLK